MLSSKSAHLNGIAIHYHRAGEHGPSTILLHGGGTDSASLSWKLTYPDLAQSNQIYMPDWPGYGQSQFLPSGASTQSLIDVLHRLMDHWRLEEANLVGVSMGGGVAIGYALSNGERVRKLVLVDSYGLQDRAPFHRLSYLMVHTPYLIPMAWALFRRSRWMTRKALENIIYDRRTITEELVDEVYQAIREPKVGKAFYAWQRNEFRWGGLRTNYSGRLNEIMVPTLIIHGEKDSLVPLEYAKRGHERIVGSLLHIMAGCGHWPQRERPEEFNRVVIDFLE